MLRLQNEIKRMLKTRSSGRPKKITEDFPAIVLRVLEEADELMGSRRGKESVPGLKEISIRLGFPTVNALGKQLVRVGYPWKYLRSYLENMPEIETELMSHDKNLP